MMAAQILKNFQGGKVPINLRGIAEVELLDLLGTGAFGTVWKVADSATKKLYVLKIIQGIKPGSVLAERVRLESEVVITSNHIVPVIGLCEWDRSTFLILFEFFQGRSLDKIFNENILTPAQKQYIFAQILTGVGDAHLHNVIHRDLKPENILVDDRHSVKLIDFGISKFKGKGITQTGDVMGTPPYMSPELLIHGAKLADTRVDIYALGHILYELSMGYTFWEHQNWRNFQDFIDYLTQKPTPTECIDLSDFHCDFYANAKDVIAKTIKTNPLERYANVREIMADLIEIKSIPTIETHLHPDPVTVPIATGLPCPMLVIESGTNRNAYMAIDIKVGRSLVLGRANIAGNDSSISREHLVFNRTYSGYFVNDLMSKNGTMLRGELLNPHQASKQINCHDRIKVGDIFLRFVTAK